MRIIFAGLLASCALIPGGALAKTTVIHAASILPDAAANPSGPATITVTDGRIISIVDGLQPAPEGAKLIDLGDRTVLPGLIDMHVHLTINSEELGDWRLTAINTDEWATASALANARREVRAGFTTVRDLLGPIEALKAARATIDKGWLPGPRMIIAGMALSTIGGHGDLSHGFRPEVRELIEKAAGATCTGPVQCAEQVRRRVSDGADVIKFMATGGVMSQGDKSLGQQLSDAEMKAIVDSAHSLGVKTAAHAHGDAGVAAAVRAGVDSIEHGTFISPATAKQMKASGTVLMPTLLPFKILAAELGKGTYSPAVETKIRDIQAHVGEGCRNARAAGVTVVFGTDTGVTPHGRNGEEFAMLVDHCGMSAREALASATTVAAKQLGLEGEIGRIAPGYAADLIAVRGNPLNDVRTLEKVEWVMARGRVAD